MEERHKLNSLKSFLCAFAPLREISSRPDCADAKMSPAKAQRRKVLRRQRSLFATFTVFVFIGTTVDMNLIAQTRPRAREAGVKVGVLPTGALNAITDVPGVLVGHTTLIRGDNIRTGVTAVLPHNGNLFRENVPGAVFIGNGFGKLAGSTQVNELGEIETPIMLTSTLAVPRVADYLIDYMLALPGNEQVQSINPLVAETNAGYLNDIRGRHISREDVFVRSEEHTSELQSQSKLVCRLLLEKT